MLCKCGGWKYWDRSERLCSDCKVGSISNEETLDSCKEIKCPKGTIGKIISDNRCPKGYVLRKVSKSSCPRGSVTYKYE